MAKNNAKKGRGESKMVEPRKALTKKILYLAIIFVLLAAGYLFLKNSPYFKLDNIEVVDRSRATELDAISISSIYGIYKGKNIFGIDINSLSSRIKKDFPAIKDAVVKRVLPNKLEIDIIPRTPIAKIKSHEYFPVDRQGVVLSPKIKTGKLPVIMGFSMWLRLRPGEKLKSPKLEGAILLLDALKESAVSSDYNVTGIDASNHRNLSFYFENGIEVKIGGEDFLNRLKKLKKTLANPALDRENIKYIDLRFKDIVIGPK